MALFHVERFNGRGWVREPAGAGLPNRGEALQVIENLRRTYGRDARFRIVAR